MIERNASTSLMEPVVIGESAKHYKRLSDLILELVDENAAFRNSLPSVIIPHLSALIRAMNCYYSNLIEGHNTHPVDIERALRGDYSNDSHKRDLQNEALAHIRTQQWMEEAFLSQDKLFTADIICAIHARFYQHMPDSFKTVTDPVTDESYDIVPGYLRDRHVKVGRHIAIHPTDVPTFLKRLEQVYGQAGRMHAILSIPCAHHRLLWVHPFVDGNGRVGRLLTNAMLDKALDTKGLWSVSRGLARQANSYKSHLAACDMDRRNDMDGRGTLSEENLAAFAEFFFTTCLDQIRFMRCLMQPDKLHMRVMLWVEEEIRQDNIPKKSDLLMKAVLHSGEISRAQAGEILGVGDRQARRITSQLLEAGILSSENSKTPLQLAFPAALAHRWMPGLFPEKIEDGR